MPALQAPEGLRLLFDEWKKLYTISYAEDEVSNVGLRRLRVALTTCHNR